MNKRQAGSLGGQATHKKYGSNHMATIGAKGAKTFHERYKLEALGTSDFAIVERATGKPTGKTIRGLVLP